MKIAKPVSRLDGSTLPTLDRRKFLIAGSAAGTGLILPRPVFAAADGCANVDNFLLRAAHERDSAEQWARTLGLDAATKLDEDIAKLSEELKKLRQYQDVLQDAMLVDYASMVSGVLGTMFVMTGVAAATPALAAAATLGSLFVGAGLMVANLASEQEVRDFERENVKQAKLQNNENLQSRPDVRTIAAGPGANNVGTILGALGDAKGIASAASQGFRMAGASLSALTIALSAIEFKDSYDKRVVIDRQIDKSLKALDNLRKANKKNKDIGNLVEMRERATSSVYDDLMDVKSSECGSSEDGNRKKHVPKEMPKRKKHSGWD